MTHEDGVSLRGGNSQNGLMGKKRWLDEVEKGYEAFSQDCEVYEATVFEVGMSPPNQYCGKGNIWAFSRIYSRLDSSKG